MRRLILLLLCCASAALAQQNGQNAPPKNPETITFTTGAQLVVETVAVTDKKGNAVEGLAAKDFTVTEDGAPQTIRVFEFQNLSTVRAAGVQAPSKPEKIRIYEKLGRSQISPSPPGDTRYKDRRMLAMYFDMTAMPAGDQFRALEAAQKFIRTHMTAADLVAIMRYSGGAVEVLQDFTDDRN